MERTRSQLTALLKALILAYWIPFPLHAANGRIAGQVTDNDGMALPGVLMTLEGVERPHPVEQHTNEEGRFAFGRLAPGGYWISAEVEGFHRGRQYVKLGNGQTRIIDMKLRLLPIREEITVTSNATTLPPRSLSAVPSVHLEGVHRAPAGLSNRCRGLRQRS